MTQIAAPTLASSTSLANLLASYLKFGASTVAVLNAAVEGGAASNPNIAPATVDRTNMRSNAKVGVYAAEAGFGSFVVTEAGVKGLQYVSASGLTATFGSGSAWVLQTSTSPDDVVRVTKATTWTVLLTATSDNYVYIKSDGSVGVATTSVGGSQPTLPADSLLLSVATTNGTTVTGTPTDASATAAGTFPANYRSSSGWPYPTSTTNFRLPPCKFEVGGLSVNNTTNQDLDVTVAGNYVSGTHTSTLPVYYIVGNNGGTARYALTMSAPSAAFLINGATSGTSGRLQFRTIGSIPYRYMGLAAHKATGAALRVGQRADTWFQPYSQISVVSQVGATTYSARSVAQWVGGSGVVRRVRLNRRLANDVEFYRESSTAGAGIRMGVAGSGSNDEFDLPISAAGKFQHYNVGGGNVSIDLVAWKEELD